MSHTAGAAGELLLRALANTAQYVALFGAGTFFALALFYVMESLQVPRDKITRGTGAVLYLGCAAALILFESGRWRRFWLPTSDLLGQLAVLVAYGAAAQWLFRRGSRVAGGRTRSGSIARLVRDVLHYLRLHHQFFAWLVFALASVHGLYFLVHPVARQPLKGPAPSVWTSTGIVAWGVLLLLVGLGLVTDRQIQTKRSARRWRGLHRVLAVVFVVTILIHI